MGTDGTFVREIERISKEAVKPEIIEIDGRSYYTQSLTPLHAPLPDTLDVNTLGGLLDAIENDASQGMGDITPFSNYIQIADANTVYYRGPIVEPWKQRPIMIDATPAFLSKILDHEVPLERFIVHLQTSFVPTKDRDALLQTLTRVDITQGVAYEDDGMSQKVTAKFGINRKELDVVKNPVMLRPYRTFPEIEQPESPFIVRLKRTGEGEKVQCLCTIEAADGGVWILAAMDGIRKWLLDDLNEREMAVPIIS